MRFNFITKIIIKLTNNKSRAILGKNRQTKFNGQQVRWFIGDLNFGKAKELGCIKNINETQRIINNNGFYWEAWGSCNGKMYQLFAWYNKEKNELSDINVLPPKIYYTNRDGETIEEDSYYFDQQTYDLLTVKR